MTNQEYAAFVDRSYHDTKMAEAWGALIGLVLLVVVALTAYMIP